jgi:carbamoyl-phosphate synthase large subunit
VFTADEAVSAAARIGYPVLVRPSYVLGGRSMEIIYDEDALKDFIIGVFRLFPDNAILIDRFLEDALEIDVDAVSDGSMTVIGGIMEHIEEAGIHSGDSACVLPPISLAPDMIELITAQTRTIADELGVVGLMNIQYAVKDNDLYVIEVNPRASRTAPFVSKAIGRPLAQIATRVMMGHSLKEQGFTEHIVPQHISVKEAVFPFQRFPGVDVSLGPEMKSTGEVMGIDADFGSAFAKAQLAAGAGLPVEGTVFISVHDHHKHKIKDIARSFADMGFTLIATNGTAAHLAADGIAAEAVLKMSEGRPNVVDHIKNRGVQLIINTGIGRRSSQDAYHIRQSALRYGVPYVTTISAARASVEAIRALKEGNQSVGALQDYHTDS